MERYGIARPRGSVRRAIGGAVLLCAGVLNAAVQDQPALDAYYAHPVREDAFGVIAPWYEGTNGQLDARVRIAVDVYKRYPWVGKDKAVMAAPDFIYNSHWQIADDGTIAIPPTNDWMCGDLGQRVWSIVKGLTAYYAYSGDPIAFLYIPLAVDYVLDYAQTDAAHAWPRFPISTPTNGKAYGVCDQNCRNQLDLCALVGREVLRAHKLTGNSRYLEAARRWGDVLAAHCRFDPEYPPWDRYVDPSVVGWSDLLTGSTALIVEFLDDLLDTGYEGDGGRLVRARDAGRAYLAREMLPQWTRNDVWARNYWDWDNPVMCGVVSMCGDYFLARRAAFPGWERDCRNMLTLIFGRNGVDPGSRGDMYRGAWAFPESSTCCGTSLSYNQYTAAPTLIKYGRLAGDARIAEIGLRMILMATYDSAENGVVRDGLLGETVATREWSNLAHPWPLCQAMEALAWAPEVLGPCRENHIMRSTSVVDRVRYGRGRVAYSTWSAPAGTVDVLRLAFTPSRVTADGAALAARADTGANGFVVRPLGDGDCLLEVRHDGAREVVVEGDDPQKEASCEALTFGGAWGAAGERGGRVSSAKGATAKFVFEGTQVRLVGCVDRDGGRAQAALDGVAETALVDSWSPAPREAHIVYSRSGLAPGRHELVLTVTGAGNPLSTGAAVRLEGVQWSAAQGCSDWGVGGGSREAQRMIFGYTKRNDYVDSAGASWRPATEVVVRTGYGTDAVARTWWTLPRSMYIGNTRDPELYRHGVHAPEWWVNLTVGPGTYRVTLKFAETPLHEFLERDAKGGRVTHTQSVWVNGVAVLADVNVAKAAGGIFKAFDKTVSGVRPEHGAIRIALRGAGGGEAIMQALEIVPEE